MHTVDDPTFEPGVCYPKETKMSPPPRVGSNSTRGPVGSPTPTPKLMGAELAHSILSTTRSLSAATRGVLAPDLVRGIHEAEWKRMGHLREELPKSLRWDLDTWRATADRTFERYVFDFRSVGAGQVTQVAYDRVRRDLKQELSDFVKQTNANGGVGHWLKPLKPSGKWNNWGFMDSYGWSSVVGNDFKSSDLEAFVILAYLAIMIEQSQPKTSNPERSGRTPYDAMMVGIGLYKNGHNQITAAGKVVGAANWPPMEQWLRAQGGNDLDLANYIAEVGKYGRAIPPYSSPPGSGPQPAP